MIDPGLPFSVQDIVVVVISIVCAYTDYKYRKIYDRMTWPVMVLGIILAFVAAGSDGAKLSALGIIAGFAFYVVPCEIGAIGGGDAKFMMAIGGLQGYIFMIIASLIGFALGGIQALYTITKRENGLKGFVKSLTTGSILTTSYEDRSSDENIPLGVYFALANIVTLLLLHYKVIT
jgi:prepilin peptidase CpaA